MKFKTIIYCLTIIVFNMGLVLNGLAQSSPDHLFKDEKPDYVQTNMLITDDRSLPDSNSAYLVEGIKQHLTKAFPSVKFYFAEKTRQLKRSGDHINIMISITKHNIVETNTAPQAHTSYHVTIYDVSQTPIYIQDGNVGFEEKGASKATLQKTFNTTNQRLIAFLKRSIKYHKFCDQKSNTKR